MDKKLADAFKNWTSGVVEKFWKLEEQNKELEKRIHALEMSNKYNK